MSLLKRILLLSALFCSVCMYTVQAEVKNIPQQQSWESWKAELRRDALNQGIRPEVFDKAFKGVKPSRRVVNLDRSQPEKRLTFMQYRKTRIDPYRITIGVRSYKRHHDLLKKIGEEFGVDPCFITAFWGIESSYGNYMGTFPVIGALATLSYDGRRADFFRKELLLALEILNGDHVSLEDFKGEWAGASGHPQFLPSSWHNFAVDYDGDGHKNIWKSYGDVFASIANYLKKNGWQTGQPWAVEVKLPANFDEGLVGYNVKKTVFDWKALGVVPSSGHWPQGSLEASIVRPYGGPDFMIFQNFRTMLKYNNSTYYAGSVGFLADSICRKLN